MAKAKGKHYVDNKLFLIAVTEWKEKCKIAVEVDERIPPVTNYMGECFLKIATHLSYGQSHVLNLRVYPQPNYLPCLFQGHLL